MSRVILKPSLLLTPRPQPVSVWVLPIPFLKSLSNVSPALRPETPICWPPLSSPCFRITFTSWAAQGCGFAWPQGSLHLEARENIHDTNIITSFHYIKSWSNQLLASEWSFTLFHALQDLGPAHLSASFFNSPHPEAPTWLSGHRKKSSNSSE